MHHRQSEESSTPAPPTPQDVRVSPGHARVRRCSGSVAHIPKDSRSPGFRWSPSREWGRGRASPCPPNAASRRRLRHDDRSGLRVDHEARRSGTDLSRESLSALEPILWAMLMDVSPATLSPGLRALETALGLACEGGRSFLTRTALWRHEGSGSARPRRLGAPTISSVTCVRVLTISASDEAFPVARTRHNVSDSNETIVNTRSRHSRCTCALANRCFFSFHQTTK